MGTLDGRHHGIVGQLVRVIHERQLASLMLAALFRMAQLTLRAAARRGGWLRAVATMIAIVIPITAIAAAATAYYETTRSGSLHAALVRQTGLVDGHMMLRTSACRQAARRHNGCHLSTLAGRGQERAAQQGAGGSGGASSQRCRTTTITRRATICIQCRRSIAAGHRGRGHAHAVRVMILVMWMLELVRQVVVMVAACEVRAWLTGHHAGSGHAHGLSCGWSASGSGSGSWSRSGLCAAWLLRLWL